MGCGEVVWLGLFVVGTELLDLLQYVTIISRVLYCLGLGRLRLAEMSYGFMGRRK